MKNPVLPLEFYVTAAFFVGPKPFDPVASLFWLEDVKRIALFLYNGGKVAEKEINEIRSLQT